MGDAKYKIRNYILTSSVRKRFFNRIKEKCPLIVQQFQSAEQDATEMHGATIKKINEKVKRKNMGISGNRTRSFLGNNTFRSNKF